MDFKFAESFLRAEFRADLIRIFNVSLLATLHLSLEVHSKPKFSSRDASTS